MSNKQNDIWLEHQAENLDPFDADKCNSEEGRTLRKSIAIEDCEIGYLNKFFRDTMDFITDSIHKNH